MARFHVATRLHLRGEILKRKLRGEIPWRVPTADLMDAVTDEVIDTATEDAQVQAHVGAFGDGTIIKNILDWFGSEQGQKFMKILLDILMSLI